MCFSLRHFHFIIGLPEAQPNYTRSFDSPTKKTQNGGWTTQKALRDLPPALRPLILISWEGIGHFQRGGDLFGGLVFGPFRWSPSL